MGAVVEFQAFYDNNNQYIVKELAIVSEYLQTQLIFKPPNYTLDSKAQRTARWLSRHYHGIKWDEGGVTYSEELIKGLCKAYETVYTKGLEKVKFLQRFHPDVIELDYPSDECASVSCVLKQHSGRFKCALMSAHAGYKHIYSK